MPYTRIDQESTFLEDSDIRIRDSPERNIAIHTWQDDNLNEVDIRNDEEAFHDSADHVVEEDNIVITHWTTRQYYPTRGEYIWLQFAFSRLDEER